MDAAVQANISMDAAVLDNHLNVSALPNNSNNKTCFCPEGYLAVNNETNDGGKMIHKEFCKSLQSGEGLEVTLFRIIFPHAYVIFACLTRMWLNYDGTA